MKKYRGLFAGLTTIDIQFFVEAFPGSNQKIKTTAPNILIGGPATNAAVAFSHLNKEALLATANGDNPFARFVAEDFKLTGIRHFDLVENQIKTAVIASVITSKNSGDRTIFTHHPEKITPSITPKELFENVNPEILMLDGFYPEFSIECARLAKKSAIPVVIDGGSWKPQYSEIIPLADVVICSEDFYPPDVVDNETLFDYFDFNNVKNAAVSRGRNSILYSTKKERGEVVIKPTEVVDTLGAGDILHGAFCYYFLRFKGNFKKALAEAGKLATFSCRFKGTREWLNFLDANTLKNIP